MNLSKCTKSELLFIIERLKKDSLVNVDLYIERYLIDLEYKRELDSLEKQKKQYDIEIEGIKKCIDLLKPYEGKKIVDIPDAILKEASEALEKSKKANKKYAKLMGLKRAN